MNIQIFGTKKDFDCKKAEQYFKERNISFQYERSERGGRRACSSGHCARTDNRACSIIDMKEKGLSKGEFQSVCQAVGGAEKLIDEKCKDKELLALVKYLADEQKPEKIFANQKIIKLPIVRNGKKATVGYQPEAWKNWD